jgi:MFS family permease
MSTLQNKPIGKSQWMVLFAALLGWMFDGLEMGLFPVAARPALMDLMKVGPGNEAIVGTWISYFTAVFLVGAAAGGVLFGWLGDKLGRVRSMALSILAYSFFTGCCYFATAPWQLAVCRFASALGMGGEWGLGVALVMESWPERLRPVLAGVIGAAGNVGYLLVGVLAMQFRVTPESWRWTMLVCSSPALLAFLIMILIPESERWKESVKQGSSKPFQEIFGPKLRKPTLLATAFATIALIGTWGAVTGFLPSWADQLAGQQDPYAKGKVQFVVSIGAIIGCFFAGIFGGRFGRRPAYFGLCVFSLVVCGFLFGKLREYNTLFLIVSGLAGCGTAAFYGWLPLYLPELFPTRVRTTGQGLSYNFGRILTAVGVLCVGQLMHFFNGSYPHACGTIILIYVLGMVLIWFAPETKGKPLPE